MVGIFYDIIAGEEFYYVAEEIEYEKGLRKFERLTGQLRKRKEAEDALKYILKERGVEKKRDSKD